MSGGGGNDNYYVDNAGDQTIETAFGPSGIDTVYTLVTRVLGPDLEILRMQGSGSLNGNGNELNNRLVGNSRRQPPPGPDRQRPARGRRRRRHGGRRPGRRHATGGANADIFRFATSNAGNDRIVDFSTAIDRFDLSGSIFSLATIAGSDTVLHHAGGVIRIIGVNTLSLAQWNALIVPPGSGSDEPFTGTGPWQGSLSPELLGAVAASIGAALQAAGPADFLFA